MTDAPSVPVDAAPLAQAATSPWKRLGMGLAGFLAGALVALLSMGAKPSLPGGLWLGVLGTLVAAGSLVAGVRAWAPEQIARRVEARALALPLGMALGALLWLWLLLRLAVAGVLPAQTPLLAVAVPAGFVWLAGASGALVGRLGFLADPERRLWQRHGFWLIVLTALVQLPRLGSFGLIDPWETHYGEVAREMLARDDWISLWWAQDGWFWSKPISNFWAQGLSFLALGVDWGSDRMIASVAEGRLPQPEWAARLPVFLMALAGQHVLYVGARAYVGRWAAFWGVFVLATTPYWYFLTRQSMADMAYVGPMSAAMGFLLLALRARPEALVRPVGISFRGSPARGWTVSGFELLLFVLLLSMLPQIFYLLSRNLTFAWGEGAPSPGLHLDLHLDRVSVGSPGNCGLPGNQACRPDAAGSAPAFQPAVAAGLWALCGACLLWLRRGERRGKRLYYLAAWLCVALSFMGKGAPGPVLVLATLGGFCVARGRFSELRHADVLGFGLVMAAVALPWFVQEYLRHGDEFFERLFIHDMYQRAFSHVHDTNKGDDTSFRYYVWQLGYGLFPWSGLCAAGALYCIGRSSVASEASAEPAPAGAPAPEAAPFADLTYFCVLWLLAGFGMFTITGTKYHHYVLPLVPAAALLCGMWCRDALARGRAGAAVGHGVVALAAVAFTVLAGRDLAMSRTGDVEGAARLLSLFTYNYARSWPATLDYQKPLLVFTLAAGALGLVMLVGRARRAGLLCFAGLSVLVALWVVDVYFVQVSPHWGQRETIATYYARRAGPNEPLVAYQLNWKGENFYTGNNVPAFVSSGKRFTEWVESQKKSGVTVMFFTTEHSRVGSLTRELGPTKKFELLTTPELNDKFVLARAEL